MIRKIISDTKSTYTGCREQHARTYFSTFTNEPHTQSLNLCLVRKHGSKKKNTPVLYLDKALNSINSQYSTSKK